MIQTQSDILGALGEEPTLARSLAVASKLDLAPGAFGTHVRFAVLRNITLEPGLSAALKIEAARAGLSAYVFLGDFDNAQGDVYDSGGPLYASQPDIIIFSLRLHVLAPRLVNEFTSLSSAQVNDLVETTIERVASLTAAARQRSPAIILLHNFELPPAPVYGILDPQMIRGQHSIIGTLNTELAARVKAIRGAYIIDVDRLIARIGCDRAIDNRYWHIARAPYTFTLQQRLASQYVRFARALKGKSKKCLVLDCDNTLWGGVIGEDGLGGIKLGETYPGSAYVDFHAAVLDLYHRGILLALNTKNNWHDALEVLENHPSSLLRPDHFVAKRINWGDKASNLREIAAELNLGLDSLVFVDDNPFECQYVRQALPDVTVVELPDDPTRYAMLLRDLPYFDTLSLSDEDRRRSEMYQSEAHRAVLKQTSGSMEEYLASLEMVLAIASVDRFTIPRIAQLTQKTNQFNLTTRRYSEEDVQRLANDPAWRTYYAELSDKCGSAGIIAAAFVQDTARESRIDTFLMSCRVIGRGIEQALMAKIAADSARRGSDLLIGEYIPTPKNEQVREFFAKLGFDRERDSPDVRWKLDLVDQSLQAPPWFREVRSEGVQHV